MKDLKFIQACPDDAYYTWQVHMWLESLRNIGQSDKAISLIFTPKNREVNPNWKQIIRKAWSIRFMTMAAILSACEVVLPLYEDTIPKNLFASLSFFFVTAAFISRIVAQRDV